MWAFVLNYLLPFKQVVGAAVVALTGFLALLWYGGSKKREGALEASVDALKEDTKKLEKAREAAYKEKRDVNGVSDSDLVNRLRRRGDDWGGL